MSVHPRSLHAARFEFSRANGGRPFPFNEATLAEIVAEVHAVAKPHQRAREIQIRMRAMMAKAYPALAQTDTRRTEG